MFRDTLTKVINNCEGSLGAVLMGFDGVSVETVTATTPVDVQTLGMELAFVLIQARKASEILQIGGLEEVTIRSGEITFIVRILTDDYFVGLALNNQGNSGKGRYLLKLISPELTAEL